MKKRLSMLARAILLTAFTLLAVACADPGARSAMPTAGGPLPSPKAGFTGVPLPATLPAPAPTATRAATRPSTADPSAANTLTILYTNDTRGYVDPCG